MRGLEAKSQRNFECKKFTNILPKFITNILKTCSPDKRPHLVQCFQACPTVVKKWQNQLYLEQPKSFLRYCLISLGDRSEITKVRNLESKFCGLFCGYCANPRMHKVFPKFFNFSDFSLSIVFRFYLCIWERVKTTIRSQRPV